MMTELSAAPDATTEGARPRPGPGSLGDGLGAPHLGRRNSGRLGLTPSNDHPNASCFPASP